MPLVTLRDLYVSELNDLYDAEQQILRELPLMAAYATSQGLRQALEEHYRQTHLHVERLELLFRQLDERPRPNVCQALRGVIEEARARNGNTERGEVLDAAIIASAQRIEHYEMAVYGCARTYAATLGDADAARILQQTLDEEGAADHGLTRLAEHGINDAAGEDLVEHATRYRSRLRYIGAADLPRFEGREWRVTSRENEHLGSLDGFIVESHAGRPLYFVIDSGGWFAGRRYVVPVGQLDANEKAHALVTELDRKAIARYPEFSPGVFLAMSDEEAARYEERLLNAVAPERTMPRGARYEEPPYRTPGWMMTGVWMTETSGFASVPPRAASDMAPSDQEACTPDPLKGSGETLPDRERLVARQKDAKEGRRAAPGPDDTPGDNRSA